MSDFTVRPARTADVRGIHDLLEPYVQRRILLGKDLVVLYESVQQFLVAEADGQLIGCGALHVIWEDLGEVRTLIVVDEWLHRGVGRALVEGLEDAARELGLLDRKRVVKGESASVRVEFGGGGYIKKKKRQ